mgnify:CR=1 FL=1
MQGCVLSTRNQPLSPICDSITSSNSAARARPGDFRGMDRGMGGPPRGAYGGMDRGIDRGYGGGYGAPPQRESTH